MVVGALEEAASGLAGWLESGLDSPGSRARPRDTSGLRNLGDRRLCSMGVTAAQGPAPAHPQGEGATAQTHVLHQSSELSRRRLPWQR